VNFTFTFTSSGVCSTVRDDTVLIVSSVSDFFTCFGSYGPSSGTAIHDLKHIHVDVLKFCKFVMLEHRIYANNNVTQHNGMDCFKTVIVP
jgi:hypothetical protein